MAFRLVLCLLFGASLNSAEVRTESIVPVEEMKLPGFWEIPNPGKRTRVTAPEYANTDLPHML